MNYIRIVESVILKSRYNQWYLIDVKNHEDRRLSMEKETATVLKFLFNGKSIKETTAEFGFSDKELRTFLCSIEKDNFIEFSLKVHNSGGNCFDINPPLDGLGIFLTNACNLDCVHCYLSSGKAMKGELNGRAWIDILEQGRKMGVYAINVSGGEPCLHKDFFEIVEYISSVPIFNANLNTNGTLIDGNEKILAQAFTSVQISIDDIDPNKHDAFRGKKGSFKKSISGIERLISNGVKVDVGFSLSEENFGILDKMVDLCENLGVTTLGIGLIANTGRAKKNNLIKPIAQSSLFLERIYQKIYTFSQEERKINIIPPFRMILDKESQHEKKFICNGDNAQIAYVMSNGSVMPCDKLPIDMFCCGNVKKKSLHAIWTSKKMKGFKLMSPRQFPKCKKCSLLSICGGPCIARAFQEGGSLESPDMAACFMAHKFSKENK